jgi:hypothetical protein
MKNFLPLLSILLITQTKLHAQANIPYTNCPDVNIAIVRAGTNNDTSNGYHLYQVNQVTGAMTLVSGGPYKDPLRPAHNLQVNGIGVNRKDGFIYGLAFDGTVTTARLVRMDKHYGVTDLGNIPSPSSSTGLLGFVNHAAGEMDTAGNYYFSAFTISPLPSPTFDKFYIGRISNVKNLVGPPVVTYHEVDVSSAECAAYISTLTSDPNNSGLKDFSYNARTNTFFTYATYKLPGAVNFSAQLLELLVVPGSSPVRYSLVCHTPVNTHNAETSGTLIDRNGKFTVLFTDGSFGTLDTDPAGVYTGSFTTINATTGLPNPLRADMGSCGLGAGSIIVLQPIDCPGSYAVVRAGLNADTTNPYSIYRVNTATGNIQLLPGELYYPGTSRALQVNGVGANKKDGKFYGLVFEGSINTARLVKFDANYNVTLLGNIPPPVSSPGTIGIVNSAAGDIDGMDNYYFTAATVRQGSTPGTFVLDKLFMGRIANVSSVTGTPSPVYYRIDWSGSPCHDFIKSLDNDPVNSGLKDLFYHPVTRTFFSYVTYKKPGDINFRGQQIELRPIGSSWTRRFRMHCKNVINSHSTEASGTMVGNDGKFVVLMTNGSLGYIPRSGSSYNYTGHFNNLNNNTGLPSIIRGDLASCVNLKRGHGHDHDDDDEEDDDDRSAFNFMLHPNPIDRDQPLLLRWSFVPEPALVDISIYDSYGTAVKTLSNIRAYQGETLRINVTNLSGGIYYLTAQDRQTGKRYQLRFLKI